MRLIDADAFHDYVMDIWGRGNTDNTVIWYGDVLTAINDAPTVDAVSVDDIKRWLYEIAMNNVGVVLDGDFSDACEEIIKRLDGLRRYSAERRVDND